LYKTNRFHVVVRLFSNRSQKTSKCGKTISDTLGYRLVCHFFLLLPHFDVSCNLLLHRRPVFSPTLLPCSTASCVLCNGTTHSRASLLYLFNFPTHSAEFSNQTLFIQTRKSGVSVLCYVFKHPKISQSQSLLEFFKLTRTRRQLSITNWTSAKLSVSSGFREKNDAKVQSSLFSLILK